MGGSVFVLTVGWPSHEWFQCYLSIYSLMKKCCNEKLQIAISDLQEMAGDFQDMGGSDLSVPTLFIINSAFVLKWQKASFNSAYRKSLSSNLQ